MEAPFFGGTTLLLVPVAASYPGRWCGLRPEVPTAFYNKIQVNGLPRNATSVTLGKESRNSQVQSLGSGGNREIGKVSKKTSLIFFYNSNIISNSWMQKIIRTRKFLGEEKIFSCSSLQVLHWVVARKNWEKKRLPRPLHPSLSGDAHVLLSVLGTMCVSR